MSDDSQSEEESGDEDRLGMEDEHNTSTEKRLEAAMADAKKDFEEDRDNILKSIPSEYSKMIGQIGFTKWSKNVLPVLILNPFHVPPGEVRDQWQNMYEKMKEGKRLDKMSYLIYWYGATKLNELYYFLPQKQFIPYEKEAAKTNGVAKLPAKLQKKVDGKSPLNAKEEEFVRAYTEVDEDLLKEPKDRRRGVLDFPEGYQMLTESDLIEAGAGGDDAQDLDLELDEPPKKKTKRRSSKKTNKAEEQEKEDEPPKKGKKRGKSSKNAEKGAYGDKVLEVEASPKISGKKRGRPSKNEKQAAKKSKRAVSDEEKAYKQDEKNCLAVIEKWRAAIEAKNIDDLKSLFSDLEGIEMVSGRFMKQCGLKDLLQQTEHVLKEAEADLSQFHSLQQKLLQEYTTKMAEVGADDDDDEADKKLTSKKSKRSAKDGSADVKAAETVVSEGIGDDEEDSGSDGRDQAFIDQEISSHDEQDDDFRVTSKTSGKAAGEKGKGKSGKAKGEPKTKAEPTKKKQKAKHKIAGPLTDKQKRRQEQIAFTECEEKYLPLIQNWKSVLQSSDAEQVQSLIAEADKVVEHFSASFLVEYGLSGIVKETKQLLKRSNCDLTAFNSLRSKLKETYNAKEALVPKGFKPKKSKTDVATSATTKQGSEEKEYVGDDVDSSQDRSAAKNESKSLDNPKSPGKGDLSILGRGTSKSPVRMGGQSSATFAKSPAKKISNPDGSKSEAAARPVAQQPRKKFSLGSLMGRQTEPPVSRESSAPDATKVPAFIKPETVQIPAWVKGPAVLDAPQESLRSYALEFLLQMAAHFPAGKIDVDSVARSLEAAIHDWAKQQSDDTSFPTVYWAKVHAIVAAVCGKRDVGSLMNLVLQGSFDSPDKLVALSDDKLAASFEGRPLYL